MPEDETDVSFADFDAPGRPYTAPDDEDGAEEARNVAESVARREDSNPDPQVRR
jgi:hypothetical protein